MSAMTDSRQDSLSAELSSCLGSGATVEMLDRVLDRLFQLTVSLGNVRCSLSHGDTIRVETPGGTHHEAQLLRALTKFRALCARLAIRCGEWSERAVSLYGDTVAVQVPGTAAMLRRSF